MIFACDLDQTLIYSRNSMGVISDNELVPVETYEGEYLSFMTKQAYHKLQLLSREVHFVPCTTRTSEQYERIFGLREGVHSRYVIVSNGGKVLVDGIPDREWEDYVREQTLAKCAPVEQVKADFDKLASGGWVLKERYCDELFYAFVINRDLYPEGVMDQLSSTLASCGWGCSLQGRKIYLVPDSISKGAAVQYVKEKVGAQRVFAAGDSLLDESMLIVANLAMAPNHGELFRKYNQHSHIQFTEQTGIRAADEILDIMLSQMEVRNAQ